MSRDLEKSDDRVHKGSRRDRAPKQQLVDTQRVGDRAADCERAARIDLESLRSMLRARRWLIGRIV